MDKQDTLEAKMSRIAEVAKSAAVTLDALRRADMKILDLSLTYQWYDEIASGRKKEEYRKMNDYYWHRLHTCDNKCPEGFDVGLCKWCRKVELKHYDAIRFHKGQGSPLTMIVECTGIRIGYGRPEWGAPADKEVYILELGKILYREDFVWLNQE